MVQTPPEGLDESVDVLPTQIGEVPPVMETGVAVTVTTAVDRPSDPFQEISAVPAVTPVTTPVEEPMVATATLPLLQ